MSADAWKTIALGQRASISFSGVDKHIVPGETKIRLCNYLDVYRNRRLRSSIVYSPGSAKDVEIRRFQLQRGDILITKDSETPDDIGIPAVVVDDLPNTICGYHLALIRPNSGLNSSFLGQYLQGEQAKKHFLCYAAGATRFGLNLRAISLLPIPDIDIDEQSSVACILDAVDSAIEHTQTATEQAKLLSHSLVRDLLDCGVDETGALRSKEISTNRFNATEIGLLPESWIVQKLSDVADVERGRFSPRPRNDPRFYNGPFPFVQTGQIAKAKGRVITDYSQTLNIQGKAVSREFPAGTIMVTIAANIGETAILGIPMCTPDSLVGVIVKESHSARFVELCLRRLRPRLLAIAPRSAQANINLTTLKPLRIPVPLPAEQERIASIADATEAKSWHLNQR